MSRAGWAAAIGLLTGVAGVLLTLAPAVSALEDSLGLRWLFFARGALTPPSNVAIVSIDEGAAARLDLPPLLRDWPRSTHARLVERLTERGASVIAFDIEFRRHGSSLEEDSQFAEAITRADRVVLVQRLEVVRSGSQEIWEQQNPIPALAEAATALAIVPIPDGPLISQFWSFFQGPRPSDLPTLPAVALQVHATSALASLLALMERAGVDRLDGTPRSADDLRSHHDLVRLMQSVREQLTATPNAVSRIRALLRAESDAASRSETAEALLDMYSGPRMRHLNFYGPPGTVCTVPYDKVLSLDNTEDLGCTLRDSIVFVGAASSRLVRADQPDTYHTIYESPDGVDFSGVELHATALANLLTRKTIRTPSPSVHLGAVMFIGCCLGAGGFWVRSHRRRVRRTVSARLQTASVLIGLAAVYMVVAHWLFRSVDLAIPLIVPLAIQFPIALVLGLLTRPTAYREQLEAVCLAVDAQGSTAIGQRLSHERYARLLTECTAALAGPPVARGAAVLPPEGDGFIGLWLAHNNPTATLSLEPARRLEACRAVLEMIEASRAFCDRQPEDMQLPIRIGLTTGTVTVDSDPDRGIFNVVGDAVNVAARIRDLNRDLGTTALASEDVVAGLGATVSLRNVSTDIRLKGVARVPLLLEIVAAGAGNSDRHDRSHSPGVR